MEITLIYSEVSFTNSLSESLPRKRKFGVVGSWSCIVHCELYNVSQMVIGPWLSAGPSTMYYETDSDNISPVMNGKGKMRTKK